MDNNGYYTGISKHSNYMLPAVNYPIPFDNFTEYQTSSQLQQQQHQPLPHQVQTTQQQHHDIQAISVKLDTIDKSPSQKIDEIQAFSGGYTGNNSATSSNDFHGNLYHYNNNGDSGVTASVSSYSDFDHTGGLSLGQKSLNSFLLPQQNQHQIQQQAHHHHHHHQQQQQQQQQPQQQQLQQQQNPLGNTVGNTPNEISQQSKVLSTFDQRTGSKCYNSKSTTATNSQQNYTQSGYKESEMPFNSYKLPPIPQTYHHVYPTYDKYSLQPRVPSTHHKTFDDINPTNNRTYIQTMPLATNHKPTNQAELFCNSSATAEHSRYSNRNYLIPNSAFIQPTNGYYNTMYRSNNTIHRSLPPPLQPAIDDNSSYFHNNNLLVRGTSYNRSQMAYQQSHYPYGRTHPIPIPKLQSKSDIEILNGLTTEDLYHRPYNVTYDHYEDYQLPPSVTHYPTKSSKVIYAPYSSNSTNAYPPTSTHQQQTSTSSQHQHQQHQNIQSQQQQQQQHHHQQQHHQQQQSVIQNQVLSSNDYSRYTCPNAQPSSITYPNKVYLQDQYSYVSHPQMIYSHGANEMPQTEMPKFNQIYDKRTSSSTEKFAFVDLEEQITGSKILKTREFAPTSAPTSSYECSKSNYNKDQYIYNYNALNNSYQQLRGTGEQDASKNQSIRDYLATWNDDEEEDGETSGGGKKSNQRRCFAAVDAITRSCGGNKMELDSYEGASNMSTPKIHVGIKVDNGGIASNNLPDIIIDIEKPKVVGCDDYPTATDKLYVLESIDVPFSDLNKYKHLSVVNKLPDNIVQIDRQKGDKLDEVEETLKLIEKCEERVRLHKSDFELDVEYKTDTCASPIRVDCESDNDRPDTMLTDPLSFQMTDEEPIDANQQPIVPAQCPTINKDDENSSNAHNKTADDDIDDDDEEPIIDGEVVRYKCVQKKVSTNGDELIHSDVSIPKLKIKIMRRKRSKSFRSRKIKNRNDSSDLSDTMQHGDDSFSNVKSLKLSCLDVINTNSFRKYLISMKDCPSQNDIQYSEQKSIENGIECVESEINESENDDEIINDNVKLREPSDLIENNSFNHITFTDHVTSQDQPKLSPNISQFKSDEGIIESLTNTEDAIFDDGNIPNDLNPVNFNENNYFPSDIVTNVRQHVDSLVNSNDSLDKLDFHTPSVCDDFADPNFVQNFEHIHNVNLERNDENHLTVDDISDTVQELHEFFPLNSGECNELFSNTANYDNNSLTESINNHDTKEGEEGVNTCPDENIEPTFQDNSDRGQASIINTESIPTDLPLTVLDSVASLIDNSDPNLSIPSNQSVESEVNVSLSELTDLIGSSNEHICQKTSIETSSSTSFSSSSSRSSISPDHKPNALEITVPEKKPMNFNDTECSSSSCSSSDDSDSDSPNEPDSPRSGNNQSNTTSASDHQLIDCNKIKKSQTSASSSDESNELDSQTNEKVMNETEKENLPVIHNNNDERIMNSGSVQLEVTELKVKIENDDENQFSHTDEQLNHHSDNESKSSYSTGSSSDESDESSIESDDDISSQKLSETLFKLDKHSPNHDSHSIGSITKTEETQSLLDTSDESSTGSLDETDSETVMKDTVPNESCKSDSSSENSDDEYVRQSPENSMFSESMENAKTSPNSLLSEDEDKKSYSSNHSDNEEQKPDIDDLTGSDKRAEAKTPLSLNQKKNSETEEESIRRSPVKDLEQMKNSTKRLSDDYIKIEPMCEDSHVSSSSTDNSDDEYVKLSPLNNNILEECSELRKPVRKLSHLSNEKITTTGQKYNKHDRAESTDGYSTSTSSSSTSSSSSDDDSYSSDDDVFVQKKTINTFSDSVSDEGIHSNGPQSVSVIKSEKEDQDVPKMLCEQGDLQVQAEQGVQKGLRELREDQELQKKQELQDLQGENEVQTFHKIEEEEEQLPEEVVRNVEVKGAQIFEPEKVLADDELGIVQNFEQEEFVKDIEAVQNFEQDEILNDTRVDLVQSFAQEEVLEDAEVEVILNFEQEAVHSEAKVEIVKNCVEERVLIENEVELIQNLVEEEVLGDVDADLVQNFEQDTVFNDVDVEAVQNFEQEEVFNEAEVELIQNYGQEEVLKDVNFEQNLEHDVILNSTEILTKETDEVVEIANQIVHTSRVEPENLCKETSMDYLKSNVDNKSQTPTSCEDHCDESVPVTELVKTEVNKQESEKSYEIEQNVAVNSTDDEETRPVNNDVILQTTQDFELERLVKDCTNNGKDEEEFQELTQNHTMNKSIHSTLAVENAIVSCESNEKQLEAMNDNGALRTTEPLTNENQIDQSTEKILNENLLGDVVVNDEFESREKNFDIEVLDNSAVKSQDLIVTSPLAVPDHMDIVCNVSTDETNEEFEANSSDDSNNKNIRDAPIEDKEQFSIANPDVLKTNELCDESSNKSSVEDDKSIPVQLIDNIEVDPEDNTDEFHSTGSKDLVYPVLDIPVKLIPLPGERFNDELYQELIERGEIFPSRITNDIDESDDFCFDLPVELIPLPGEMVDKTSSRYVELKRIFFENKRSLSQERIEENVEVPMNSEKYDLSSQKESLDQSQIDLAPVPLQYKSLEVDSESILVRNPPMLSLKSLCERVLTTAGLHYEEDDQIETPIDCDGQDFSYVYIVSDEDDFWDHDQWDSSSLVVCYDGELDDEVFVDGNQIDAPLDESIHLDENLCSISNICPSSSSPSSIDSFTIDTHDIQYEEIVPVNRTMYKLETFKRYLQSKYIQKPNYFQKIKSKILKKYSNYQRYSTKYVQTKMVQKSKKNFKNLLKNHSKINEKLPITLATDRLKVKENGQIPKNDVLRSNCDINKSKLLSLTNNNVKNKRNLNATQRNHKLNVGEVSNVSSYVSEMTKNNHLNESRASAKEIITKKRSIKSDVMASSMMTSVVKLTNAIPSHSKTSPVNQLTMSKRKISETVLEPMMITRNNKKRKLSFDDTLLDINRIYKQTLIVELDKFEMKSSSSGSSKRKERPNSNSNILNNSKDKVRRLVIPKSKIFDGSSSVSAKIEGNPLVQIRVPYVKLERSQYIDKLSKSYSAQTFRPSTSNRK